MKTEVFCPNIRIFKYGFSFLSQQCDEFEAHGDPANEDEYLSATYPPFVARPERQNKWY